MSPRRSLVCFLAPALLAMAACDAPGSELDAGQEPTRVSPRFALAADPMPFGAIPWPDDLYLDESGHVRVGELPSEASALPETFPESLRESLAELDGFSALAPAFFYFPPDSLDPASLPAGPPESTREDSTVFLLDADPASPTAFRARVPVLVHWSPGLGQLALRPHDGHPLVAGRRYAAVVTTGVLDAEGTGIGPDARFAAIRDATSRPADPLDAEAWDRYTPVLGSLASSGIPRERVAGLAVFTVQRVRADLRDARAIVWEGERPTITIDATVGAGAELDALLGVPEMEVPGVDVPGGVAHRAIAWLVQGRFRSPSFLSARPGVHGRFARDAGGQLLVRRVDDVPFTLTLPAGELTRVPIVVFQHGLGAERADAMAVAGSFAEAGWATLAIDIPFHGMRALGSVVDLRHRFGATEGPDGFGDRRGAEVNLEFLGVLDDAGGLPAFHPFYVRDVLKQSVVDLMSAVRVIREGDWSPVAERLGRPTMGFSPDPLGFVGVSLGGIIGTVFVAMEPEIGAAVLNVTGGDLTRLVEGSADYHQLFLTILLPRLGLDAAAIDPRSYPISFHPELAVYQTLLDGGDSMAFAPTLADRPVDLLFQMAEHDEAVPNRATESLARAAGASLIDADPVHTDLARASSPLADNVVLGASRVTRGLHRFAPATHGLLSRRSDQQAFQHPPEPPFAAIRPIPVENPVDAAVDQVVHFFETWRGGTAQIAAPAP